MKVKKMIEQIGNRAFDENFYNTIYGFYDGSLHPYPCDTETQADYQDAMKALPSLLTQGDMEKLHQAEELYTQNRGYAAKYGFLCGIFAGFQQFFTDNDECDGGFYTLVCKDLFLQPRMQRHHESYHRHTTAQVLEKEIIEKVGDDCSDHMISFSCAWNDRIYNAAFEAFYCGYRAAFDLIDQIKPLAKMDHIKKILTMEYYLGYIQDHCEADRLQAKLA